MNTIYEYIIFTLLGLWFIATMLHQFKNTGILFRVLNSVFGSFMPNWSFFAPNPGKYDYHLLYRQKPKGKDYTEWTELNDSGNRYWYSWIWNPGKREKKILSDVIQSLNRIVVETKKEDMNTVIWSLPYIIALNLVCKRMKKPVAKGKIQFVLASTNSFDGSKPPRLIFLSALHPNPND